jgi:hypothetical protein
MIMSHDIWGMLLRVQQKAGANHSRCFQKREPADMRIFYASDTTPNALFQSNLWRNNLYLPLVDLGHYVVELHYAPRDIMISGRFVGNY